MFPRTIGYKCMFINSINNLNTIKHSAIYFLSADVKLRAHCHLPLETEQKILKFQSIVWSLMC